MLTRTAEPWSGGKTLSTARAIRRSSRADGKTTTHGTLTIDLMLKLICIRLEVKFTPLQSCLLQPTLTCADYDMNYTASCSAFRSLQGWCSLSHTSTGEGTLRLIPELKLSTAYQLLRPYFILNETFDEVTPLFPGATPGNLQFLPTEELHPHLLMEKSMVGIPPVRPGDYVFWHCDLVHEVDKFHPGERDSSVSYNACVPLCPYNVDNLIATRDAFLAVDPPRDFIRYDGSGEGELEKAHDDHGARIDNVLSLDGKRALGLEPFDENEEGINVGQREMRKFANFKLGFINS